MSQRYRIGPAGYPQHVVQRGVNRMPCFREEEDRAAYAHWLGVAAAKYGVDIHAWVFMTNHVHLLVTPRQDLAVSRFMQYLGRFYVRYFNATYDRSGTLWECSFYSSVVEEDAYFLACQRYIELNPVRAGMTETPGEYHWSSYQSNGLGRSSTLASPHSLYLGLGRTRNARLKAYRGLCGEPVNEQESTKIRNAVRNESVLGSIGFIKSLEKLTGRRLRPQAPGEQPG